MVGTVNAGREQYEVAVQDMALAESQFPGWLSRLLTYPVAGLDNYRKTFMRLSGDSQANKVFVEVVPLM